jgi:hypothetical protein
MKRLRLASAILLVAGLVLGAFGSSEVRVPPLVDGYRVLAGDFHVHGFLGDGGLMPWDLAREARRRRLDVIALTNHNQMLAANRTASWFPIPGLMILPSQELTAPRYHLAAVGIARAVDWRGSIPAAAAAIHAQGGVAIGSHPAGDLAPAFDDAALAALDGVETAHPTMHLHEDERRDIAGVYARARIAKPGIAAIGSSDFHFNGSIGLCRTYLFARAVTPEAVLDAIRGGRTVACDQDGVVYGEPALAAKVEADCRLNAALRVRRPALQQAALACAWLGLLGLVLAGFPEALLGRKLAERD